jgi:DNA-binding NarL/FixJ family response regulator
VAVRVTVVGTGVLPGLVAQLLRDAGFDVRPFVAGDGHGPGAAEVAVVVHPGTITALPTELPAVVIAASELDDDALAALVVAGADAVVGVDAEPADVCAAVRAVAAGSTVVSGTVARRLARRLREGARPEPRPVALPQREMAVLLAIVEGSSVKQTARTLGLAVKTVENTQSRLYRRLGVRNRAQAVIVAHQMGLIGDGAGA